LQKGNGDKRSGRCCDATRPDDPVSRGSNPVARTLTVYFREHSPLGPGIVDRDEA